MLPRLPARPFLLLASVLLAAPPAHAGQPFDFDRTPGHLPKDVLPLAYDIALVPELDALRLRGTESVRLKVRRTTQRIVMDTLGEQLDAVRVDGQPVAEVHSDDAAQRTTLSLARPLAPGEHTLRFTYTAKIETDPHGLFAQRYARADGSQGVLLTTQMEAIDARRMFPCWDEPAFRATFHFSLTAPAAWTAVSNMPVERRSVHGELATTSFRTTPRMPAYLVELTAGEIARIGARRGGTEFGVWAVRGLEQKGATALANAEQILADYNDYFGARYPLPKLDSLAIPGGFTGAMENWGAITYNDQLLLLGANSTLADRQNVYSVQAHEMAHQWNGDLVTMGWWDDLWLNESFASWMAARETDLRNPDWHWWEGQDADKESAMEADASAASHPIMTPVRDEVEVANASDPQITYSKGQAVLRMLESYLGPDTFRAGVRAFLHARAYSNATSEDLWQALDAASGKKVSEVAAGWTEQAGFPLVSVSAACDAQGARSLRLAQARFLLRGTPPPARWRVPLRLRSGSDGAVQPLLLTEDGQAVAAGRCDAPLSLNADDVGFYRVRYDEATLAANTRAFASLPEADRIALLDDQWALVEAGAQELPGYLALVAAMRPGMHARAWDQVAHALGTLETAQRGRPGHDAFAAFARAALAPEAARLGWEPGAQEPADLRQLRRTLLGFLGAWGDPATRAEAHRRFERFAADRGALAPDDQALVLSLVAIDADAATFERLHELARKAPDEAELRRDYQALMSVRDPALAAQAAQIALSEEIPPQAADLRLSLLLALADGNPAASWSAFTGNSERLLAPYVSIAPLLVSQVLPQVYWREVPLEQIEGWIREHVPADLSTQVAHGMDNARFRVSERDALVPAADRSLAAVRG